MDEAMQAAGGAITVSDRWSFVMGWVSIACWAFPVFSQIQENYALKSTEGLSIWFILIWLGGDAFNLLGGLLQGVLLTMINLALYYCICDLVLIWQWWYYGKYYKDGQPLVQENSEAVTESTPLVSNQTSSVYIISHIPVRLAEKFEDLLDYLTPHQVAFIKYVFTTLFVIIVGVVAYFAADTYTTSISAAKMLWTFKNSTQQVWHLRWDAQLLGWLSAVLYLTSRIPQIFKNRHTKCAGLSLALFIFALAGNATYVLSILLKDMSWPYLVENMSWIMGSVGTIFLDFIVLYQFIKYAPERRRIESNYPHHL